MKKNLIVVLSLICVVLILPAVASAYTLESLVDSIIKAAQILFMGVAVVCFIMAGILFLTSRGDAEKLGEARSAVLWGVAGVIVSIIAPTIIEFVKSFIH